MATMTWKDAYSVGIASIDQQHKKLIDLINVLDGALQQGKSKEILDSLLADLVSYCATRFATEEKLMRENNYPDFQSHREKHRKMTAKVLALQKDVKQGKAMVSMEVMKFLQQWLDKHILGTDKKYSTFLTSRGVR